MSTKKNQAKTLKESRWGFLRNKFVFITVAIIAIIFAIWTMQHMQTELSVRHDRMLLDSVDQQMGKDFNDVLNQIGVQPTSTKHDKNCTYPNTDGDPGPPSCGIVYEASYAKDDSFTALNEKIKTKFMLGEPSSVVSEPEHVSYWVFNKYNMQCAMQIDHNGLMRVSLWCGKSTKKEIYKVYDYNL